MAAGSGRTPQPAPERMGALLDVGIGVAAPIRDCDDPVQIVRSEAVPIGRSAGASRPPPGPPARCSGCLGQEPARPVGVVGHRLAVHRVVAIGDGSDEEVDAAWTSVLTDVLQHGAGQAPG